MANVNFKVKNGLQVGTGVTISSTGIISATSVQVSGISTSTFPQLNVGNSAVTGTINVYRTYTDASNNASLNFSWSGNSSVISLTRSGSPSYGDIQFVVGGLASLGILNTSNRSIRLIDTADFGWSQNGNVADTADVTLFRDSADVLAQRRSGIGQTFRVYNTYTSATNFERGQVGWTTNTFIVGTEKGSAGGTARQLELQTDGITRVAITTDGRVAIGTTGFAESQDLDGTLLVKRDTGIARIRVRNNSGANGTYSSLNLKTPNSDCLFMLKVMQMCLEFLMLHKVLLVFILAVLETLVLIIPHRQEH